MVLFHTPWCVSCHPIIDHFNALAGEFDNVVFGLLNAEESARLAAKEGVRGYPTIYFYRSSTGERVLFTGKRDLQTLRRFALDNAQK